jgi:chromosome segregation and condensation protein ScpB
MGTRIDRESQAQILRAVLLAGDRGLSEEDLEERCEALSAAEVDRAVDTLVRSGLLDRIEARLHASGPARSFNRLRPV